MNTFYKENIIASYYMSGRTVVGFIAFFTQWHLPKEQRREWIAVCGAVPATMMDEYADLYIASWGTKLTAIQAAAFFPQLDISHYKVE